MGRHARIHPRALLYFLASVVVQSNRLIGVHASLEMIFDNDRTQSGISNESAPPVRVMNFMTKLRSSSPKLNWENVMKSREWSHPAIGATFSVVTATLLTATTGAASYSTGLHSISAGMRTAAVATNPLMAPLNLQYQIFMAFGFAAMGDGTGGMNALFLQGGLMMSFVGQNLFKSRIERYIPHTGIRAVIGASAALSVALATRAGGKAVVRVSNSKKGEQGSGLLEMARGVSSDPALKRLEQEGILNDIWEDLSSLAKPVVNYSPQDNTTVVVDADLLQYVSANNLRVIREEDIISYIGHHRGLFESGPGDVVSDEAFGRRVFEEFAQMVRVAVMEGDRFEALPEVGSLTVHDGHVFQGGEEVKEFKQFYRKTTKFLLTSL